MKETLLVVDDELNIRKLIERILSGDKYRVVQAADGLEALDQLHQHPEIRLVITDLRMPRCDGLRFIEQATSHFQRFFEFIVLTGDGEKSDAVQAMRHGVREFLDKPITQTQLLESVETALTRIETYDQQQEQFRQSEVERFKAKQDIALSNQQLVDRLAVIAQYRDVETAEHCIRVGVAAEHLAKLDGTDPEFQEQIRLAAILHDIGKIGVPDSILFKEGPLSSQEFEVMKTHTEIGYKMLVGSDNAVIQLAADIARNHHERWDGSGYCRGSCGTGTPYAARIVTIADVYDALRSKRRYKSAFSHDQAVAIITEGDGRTDPAHFDPSLLALFKAHHQDFNELFKALPDKEV